ncbi:beta-ketoacyl synthase N-terminal-like domain-containing protein [Aquimarina sp. 2201CG14-23]|uniref:beta-ketoacyl synthase N-terminal-like domain-containing protein n=1 Tax=Aquimarina mycalae TaxID=3040073 RepID=UPI002477E1B9|nr:beta-ketoacyl synthase N-terminal-like domain-containing protein [Aquimarina sp. 2201CG14-23]MDH7446737.1 beta-ketoacyl synthase N-terminal-like domain-containing protein [Aquimarina sp. 2201CG14-23]
MSSCFINGIASISAQPTTEPNTFLEEIIAHKESIFRSHDPNYKEYIKPAAMRRMSKSVKMGVTTASMALDYSGVDMPDAIITGTGMGCKQDSEKFLENILHNDEQFLTPTLFIQSTHNTVGGQVALGLGCKAYNVTYVQGSASFETSVMDAQLMLSEEPQKNILVGGIDEVAKNSTLLHRLDGQIKEDNLNVLELLNSKTAGTVNSEGATFMVLGADKNEKSIAEIVDVETISTATPEGIKSEILSFVDRQGISIEDIDAVVLGNNGDVNFDDYFENLQTSIFSNKEQLCYKHLIGDYPVASSFGFWLGCKIFETNTIPSVLKVNDVSAKKYDTILLYNQYLGKNHSIVLLQRC